MLEHNTVSAYTLKKYNKQGFDIGAEWHFSANTVGIRPCDGVARAS